MFSRAQRLAFPALVLMLGGCASLQSEGRPARYDSGIRNEAGATIISGAILHESRGTILDAVRGRVPGMRVFAIRSGCPQVSLRSHVATPGAANPLVYLDGTRTFGTCLLDQIRAENIASVEIYPMGVTRRPGYSTHAHGLILVFRRSATG